METHQLSEMLCLKKLGTLDIHKGPAWCALAHPDVSKTTSFLIGVYVLILKEFN
jgi:hypothetical protein